MARSAPSHAPGFRLGTTLLAAAAAAALAGCVDSGNEPIVILQNQAPTMTCAPSASETDTYRPAGRIDVRSPIGYVFTPVARNFTQAVSGQEQQRIAFVRGARIDLRFQDTELFDAATRDALRAEGLTRFEVPFSASINPGGTTSMVFEILPAELLERIAPRLPDALDQTLIYADVRLFGVIGSADFVGDAFQYPITVCNGCTTNVLAACSSLDASFAPTNRGSVCNPYQDDVVDCCVEGSTVVCPAVGTAPAP